MGWRTVYITEASKLSLSLNNLEVIYKNNKYHITLSEISNIVIEDYKCIVTVRLLIELAEKGIDLIITKLNKEPVGSFHCLNGNSRTAKYSKQQLTWTKQNKELFWQYNVINKIENQVNTLKKLNKKHDKLIEIQKLVKVGDKTNKEGTAAKIYFHEMFGLKFKRFDEDIINSCLNYIYQVIRSKIAQEIISRGLHPSFGVFHKNEYNFYNLADDLIEVYRPIADYFVYKLLIKNSLEFLTPDVKLNLVEITKELILFDSKKISIENSIPYYVNEVILYFNNIELDNIKIPQIANE